MWDATFCVISLNEKKGETKYYRYYCRIKIVDSRENSKFSQAINQAFAKMLIVIPPRKNTTVMEHDRKLSGKMASLKISM